MNNKIEIFKNAELGEVRTVMIKEEPFFVLNDVCTVMEIKNDMDVSAMLDEEDMCVSLSSVTGKRQGVQVINESGLYALIIRSGMPKANLFHKWVTNEILPSIRQTGGCVANSDVFVKEYLKFADEQTKKMFKVMLETAKQQNAKIEECTPKVIFANAVDASMNCIKIGELAKLLKQNGVQTGQNRLFELLRRGGYLLKNNMPAQKAMDMELFKVGEYLVETAEKSFIKFITKVTPKGQKYFINKFLQIEKDENS